MLIGVKGRRRKPLVRLGSYKPTTFRWWVVDRGDKKVSKMAKKEHKQGNISIENIKEELISQITGLVEVQSDQEGIQLTKEIYGKKLAVNVSIQASGEDDMALIEVQLLAKPFVNETKKIETKVSGKHSDVVSLIKKAIYSCRMLHGIKIEIDSIVSDFSHE